MTFGLTSWLKSTYPDLNCEVPVFYPSKEVLDTREWLITNGLGGYASSTVAGAHVRRYHGLLICALSAPRDRHVILSRAEEELILDGKQYALSTNFWASGVVAPTGYKLIESFTLTPTPTWVYEIDGHYLIKQIAVPHGKDLVQVCYFWQPELARAPQRAEIQIRFLTGFRYFHDQVRGDSSKSYPQFLSQNHTVILLGDSSRRLHISWQQGKYQPENQWWWDYHWPKETLRALPDQEDLLLVGSLAASLDPEKPVTFAASLDRPADDLDFGGLLLQNIRRQRLLIEKATLSRTVKQDLLVLACDQFLVANRGGDPSIMEGYPWFNDSGRAALCALPGLLLATHRHKEAKSILAGLSGRMLNGLLPNRCLDTPEHLVSPEAAYGSSDVSLWWGWALFHYYNATGDDQFVREQFPLMLSVVEHYVNGTNSGIIIDDEDGLLYCARTNHAFTWMDAKVADISISPRSGKPVELSALWYNFLETIVYFADKIGFSDPQLVQITRMAQRCRSSMHKFWNEESQCLFDVIETDHPRGKQKDASIRPNQLFALSLPFRSLSSLEEKSILLTVEIHLLTPLGIRTLSPDDPSYQRRFGCGLAHADQYHRDLSYHNGTAWPWLLGHYFAALLNVFGPGGQSAGKIKRMLEALLNGLTEESCLGSIPEIFDGELPQSPHGCYAYSLSVAECMRWVAWRNKQL
jgi:predicted glycogen debranching enzyme